MRIGRRLFSTKGTAVDQIPAARRVVASLPLVGRRQKTTPLARFPTIQCDIQRNRHRSHTKGRTRPQEKYYWSSFTERRWVSQNSDRCAEWFGYFRQQEDRGAMDLVLLQETHVAVGEADTMDKLYHEKWGFV